MYDSFPYDGYYVFQSRAEIAASDKHYRRVRYHSLLFIEKCSTLSPEAQAELAAISVEFEGEPIEGALPDSEYEFMRNFKRPAA